MVDLEKLLETEKTISKLLDGYLEVENDRLSRLKLFRDNYKRVHSIASRDVQGFLANPVNAYLLVKRLTTDWKTVENLVTVTPAEIGRATLANLSKSIDPSRSFPSGEDLSGAADALIRLQETYKLDTSTIASGQIPTGYSYFTRNSQSAFIQNDLELSAGDCFELGRHSYTIGDFYHTTLWMKEALNRVKKEENKSADEAEILEYLAFCTFKEGNITRALEITQELIDIEPDHQRALGNREYFTKLLQETVETEIKKDETIKNGPVKSLDREVYEALCRGEKLLSDATLSQLSCYHLDTSNVPYFKLAKIRVEEAFKQPQLVIFHDILSEDEIEKIKQLASSRLKRSTVQNSVTGAEETANYRIGKTAWLKDTDDEVVKRVNRRISLITGLTSETAEDTQVVNYGIGGHYEVHLDFTRKDEKNTPLNELNGNRISTWLNYMSDVEAGGATVFPDLKVTLWPKKGSAAYWWNLYRNGEGDMLTRHAACPVLVGSKWISNKWFHERGQEFRRPCGLSLDE